MWNENPRLGGDTATAQGWFESWEDYKTLQKFPEMGSDHSYTSGENTNSALKSVPAAHGINLIAVLIHAGNFHASSNSVLFPKYTTVGTTVIEVIICYFFINN